MSRGSKRFRLGRTLAISTITALISTFFIAGVANAQTTCTITTVDGLDILAVNADPDQTVALRVDAGGVDVAEDPNASASDFNLNAPVDPDCTDAAGIEVIEVNGTDAGNEQAWFIEDGDGSTADFGDFQTTVDLGAGNDTLRFMTADTDNIAPVNPTPGIVLHLGTSATGDTVVDQGTTDAGNALTDCDTTSTEGDCSDLVNDDAENLLVTGGNDPAGSDFVNAQGDFGQGFADGTTTDLEIPGTAGHGGAPGNEPNGGNLQVSLLFDAGPGSVDVVAPGDAADDINGGAGVDDVEYNEAPAAVEVDLEAGTATGGSGDDTISDIQDTDGTFFDDTLLGSGLENSLDGFCGNDFIDGRAEDDFMEGDSFPTISAAFCTAALPEGNDTFYQGAAADGEDTIFGDGEDPSLPNPNAAEIGLDTVDYGDRTGALFLDATGVGSGEGGCAPPAPAATCEGDSLNELEHFIAGSGNDEFAGSGGEETFTGGAGDDHMSGAGGEDYFDFFASPAGVTVDVPAGTATGDGSDTFDSTVEGFNGSDAGADTFIDLTTQDNDYVGNGGDDTFNQGASPAADFDFFHGGGGNDLLDYSGRSVDLLICLNGENPDPFGCDEANNGEGVEADIVGDDIENANGGSGDDDIDGNERNNVLSGNDGNDTAFGDAGNDTFPQGAAPDGADDMNGGSGADFVDYSGRTGNVRASLGAGAGNNGENCTPGDTGACEGDSIDGVENASTGSGNDQLVGSGDDNILNGNDGRDVVNPGGGNDLADGGGGRDLVTFATGVGVVANLGSGVATETGGGLDQIANFENLTGSQQSDILVGRGGRNVIRGLAGGDSIKGKNGRDVLHGNQGNDEIRGQKGRDRLLGDNGRDFMNGGAGRDFGNGGPGNDTCRNIEQRKSC